MLGALRHEPHALRHEPQSRNRLVLILCNLENQSYIKVNLIIYRACGSRRNAITGPARFPIQEECASGQEQRCSGSRDRHSTGG